MQDTADQIALLTSTVLNKLFPEQWRGAMVLLSQRINRAVAEDDLGTRGTSHARSHLRTEE